MQADTPAASQMVLDGILSSQLTLKMCDVGSHLIIRECDGGMNDPDRTRSLLTNVFLERRLADTDTVHTVVNDKVVLNFDDATDMSISTLREDPDGQAIALAEDQ